MRPPVQTHPQQDDARHQGRHDRPVAHNMTDVNENQGELGQCRLAGFVNPHEARQHEEHQRTGGGDRHQHHDQRIRQSAEDALARVGLKIEVSRQDGQHLDHSSGGLRGLHHTDEHLVERVRIEGQGPGEHLAAFDAFGEIQDDGLESRVCGLFPDGIQGVAEDDAAVQHDRQLRGEENQVAGLDAHLPHRRRVRGTVSSTAGTQLDSVGDANVAPPSSVPVFRISVITVAIGLLLHTIDVTIRRRPMRPGP